MPHFSKVLLAVLGIFLIVAAAFGGFLFYNYQQSQNQIKKLKENPQTAAKIEIEEVKTQISKLMELPQNEEPTLATVTDINKLRSQQFFSQAVNGDKVLIYTKSSKAILYRPETNKIIEVASVNLNENQNQQVSPSQMPKLKVVIYNGTTVTGATEIVQKTINTKVTNLEVVSRENAKRNTYDKTIVVDLSGKQKQAANQLSQVLGASVGPLPQGEIKPENADLLIIYGR